jgi:hypothetical protein
MIIEPPKVPPMIIEPPNFWARLREELREAPDWYARDIEVKDINGRTVAVCDSSPELPCFIAASPRMFNALWCAESAAVSLCRLFEGDEEQWTTIGDQIIRREDANNFLHTIRAALSKALGVVNEWDLAAEQKAMKAIDTLCIRPEQREYNPIPEREL